MKKLIIVALCLILLSGCNTIVINESIASTYLNTSLVSINSNISSEKQPLNFSAKIYSAKKTADFSSDLLYPESDINQKIDSNFYYDQLPNKFKNVYTTLCEHIEGMSDGFIDVGYLNDDEISLIITSIKNDKPQYFWLGRDYITNTKADSYKQVAFKYKGTDYSIDYLCNEPQRNEILSKIKSIISNLDKQIKNKSAYEKEIYIHDFIVNNCTYNNKAVGNSEAYPHSYSIYGSLILKNAVCEGYSKAIQLLNNYFGIYTTVVVGTSNNQNHMWNLIKLDDSYYHLDATFNDSSNSNMYAYFNLSDKTINRTHKIDNEFYDNNLCAFTLPKASSVNMSYFAMNNSLIGYDAKTDISAALDTAISNRKASVDFGYDDSVEYFYINNKDFQNNGIDIAHIINLCAKKHKLKISDISIIFASNKNFKITWQYK